MLRYLSNSQINYPEWDACIAASGQPLVYALSWYLDAVSPNWAGLVADQEGRYLAVMPLPEEKKMGIPFLRQPVVAQQLGLFARPGYGDTGGLLTRLLSQYALISRYCFHTGNQQLSFPTDPNLQVQQQYTHHLDLSPPYETLYRQYSRDRKLNLRRARQAGLQVLESQDIQPLICLFQADAASRITGGVAEASYRILTDLYGRLQARGMASLYYTQTAAGEWDAGCLFVRYAGQITYLFNAASVAGRPRNGRTLLIDRVIRAHAGQPYVLDFESPAAVADIIRVYRGFNALPVSFYSIQYNRLPAPVRWVKQARQFFYQKVLPARKPGLKA